MTSAIACRYADRFAAAAPVAGIRNIKGCDPSRPVPVIAFHGTADGFVDYNGGLGAKAAQLPAGDGSGRTLAEVGAVDAGAKGPTIPEITADWAKRNGCATKPTETSVAADVTLIKFPCPKNDEVELYRVTGGGHTWPGSEFSKQIVSAVGPTTSSISANDLIFKFFEAHPLPSR
jgi:polyhydroxybutyrate depolymerase